MFAKLVMWLVPTRAQAVAVQSAARHPRGAGRGGGVAAGAMGPYKAHRAHGPIGPISAIGPIWPMGAQETHGPFV